MRKKTFCDDGVNGTGTLNMVGGQSHKVDIGLNSEARGWVVPQQSGNSFGGTYAQGPFKRSFSQSSRDSMKLISNSASATSLDINYRDRYPHMEQREQQQRGGEGAEAEQRSAYRSQLGRDRGWGLEDRAGVEANYEEIAGIRGDMSVSEGSQSEGTDEEDDEEDDDEDDDDDEGDMVENEVDDADDDKEGQELPEQGGGMSSIGMGLNLPMIPTAGLDHLGYMRREPLRVDGGFQRNMLKAPIGMTGASNSPFGMFHSTSATMPFLSSFSSPSNSALQIGAGGHSDVTPTQNRGGMGDIGYASGASYTLTGDGGLSRDVTRVEFRETLVVTPLQEASRTSSGPLHEQLQTSDSDNYYTTLLNTKVPPNNGLKRADSVSGRNSDPQANAEESLRRILSDPLTGALMDDAMIISCGHSVGNAGRRRVMETSVCIICGASVRTEAMAPNYALRVVVQAFKREEEMNGNICLRSAKRRREIIQENISLPEQIVADATKVKGVQFPFVVSDRVMIKGNKRTPERFVGREAVITTQCLNGWYLVRTLDSGESVRLQYRSLQKMRGQTPPNAGGYGPT